MRFHTGVYRHRERVCTESGLWEKNPLLHRGIEPASAACRSDALPTELHEKKKKKEEKEKRMWVAICPIDPSFGSCLPANSLSLFGLISTPSSPRRTLIFKNSPRNRISKEVDCVLLDIQGLIMYIP